MDASETYAAVRARDRPRYWIVLYAPEPARERLALLFRFNAELAAAAAQARDPMLRAIRLAWWRESLDRAATGGPAGQPAIDALIPLLAGGDAAPSLSVLSGLVDALDGEDGPDDIERSPPWRAGAAVARAAADILTPDAPTDWRQAVAAIGGAYGALCQAAPPDLLSRASQAALPALAAAAGPLRARPDLPVAAWLLAPLARDLARRIARSPDTPPDLDDPRWLLGAQLRMAWTAATRRW